ncbi:MAG TPA: hypothetical protein VLO11_10965, partial [Luteolibacter sp.]|nr:hypothetical protein [Luteolibacter sp.]
EGHAVIKKEDFIRTPMYQSDRRAASTEEAMEWTHRFFQTLAITDASADYSDLLLEVPGGMREGLNTKWIRRTSDSLRELRSHLGDRVHRLTELNPLIQSTISGGRTRIAIPLPQEGSEPEKAIQADLVHTDGRWLCVKLRF